MDNLNIDLSSGCILYCFFGCEAKIHNPKPLINQVCKEIHTATLGMKLTSVVCKLEIKINLSKSKVKFHPYSKSICTTKCVILPLFKIKMHDLMCNLTLIENLYAPPNCNHALIQNQYAPPNVESRSCYNSIYTTCQDLNQGPSACKLSVQTTTPPVLDIILIEQQAIILPR